MVFAVANLANVAVSDPLDFFSRLVALWGDAVDAFASRPVFDLQLMTSGAGFDHVWKHSAPVDLSVEVAVQGV